MKGHVCGVGPEPSSAMVCPLGWVCGEPGQARKRAAITFRHHVQRGAGRRSGSGHHQHCLCDSTAGVPLNDRTATIGTANNHLFSILTLQQRDNKKKHLNTSLFLLQVSDS